MEEAPEDVDAFLAGVDALHIQGNLDKAGLYLSMLSPVLLDRQLFPEALRVLRRMAVLAPRERGLRHGLLTSYKALYANDPRLPVFLEKTGLETGTDLRAAMEKMDNFLGLEVGRYVFHPAGWGAGRVVAVDPADVSVIIDFEGRKGHRISMEMACKVCEFLDPGDIRAMKFDRRDELLRLAEEDPIEVIRAALRSRRGKATLKEIRDRITAGVVDQKSWSRWWQKSRTRIKTAPDITMTPGNNPTLEIGAGSRGYPQACLRDLAMLDGDSARVRYFRDLISESQNHDDGPEALAAVARALVGPDGGGAELALGPRISLAYLLQEARTRHPNVGIPTRPVPAELADDPATVIPVLADVPVSGHRLAILHHLKAATGSEWPGLCQEIIRLGEPDCADHCVGDLVRSGHLAQAVAAVRLVADRYRDHPLGFLWYLKASLGGRLPANVPSEGATSLFEKALLLHDHLALAALREKNEDHRKAGRALVALFQAREYAFVKDAFGGATPAEGRNLANILANNRSIHRETCDHMRANMFRTRPELARPEASAANSNAQNPLFDPGVLYCTEASLLRKRQEFEDLVNRQIPENAQEIGRAASYGDLSENSEWSAAIEKQSRLTRQSEEMAAEIAKARIVDPAIQDGEHVVLGSRVHVRSPEGEHQVYTVLGPWEVDMERRVISYLSPLGQALIGHRPGDHVTVLTRAGPVLYEIQEVE